MPCNVDSKIVICYSSLLQISEYKMSAILLHPSRQVCVQTFQWRLWTSKLNVMLKPLKVDNKDTRMTPNDFNLGFIWTLNAYNKTFSTLTQQIFTFSKSTIKTVENVMRSHWRHSGVFNVKFEHISQPFLFLLLTLNRYLFV